MKELKKDYLDFRKERSFDINSNGKDLAISLLLESSELLEVFQWSGDNKNCVNKLKEIKEELADVFLYSIAIADYYDLDLVEIAREKMIKNRKKYKISEKG